MTTTNLIGKQAEVVESKNRSLLGIKGKIVDETKNTITISIGEKQKKLIKSQIALKINSIIVKPSQRRPEEIK